MAENEYYVDKKTWEFWSDKAQNAFNQSFKFFINNQSNMVHPKAPVIEPAHWRTIAWNAAWIAADACDELTTEIVRLN